MIRITILFFTILVFSNYVVAQLPNVNTKDIDISMIDPDEITPDRLKELGFSDAEIDKIMRSKDKGFIDETDEISDGKGDREVEDEESADETTEEAIIESYEEDEDIEVIYGHQFFRNSNLMLYESAKDIRAPDNYILGAGDEVSIVIWGYSDFGQVFTIDKDGWISPKLTGRIYLKGLAFKRARSLIVRKFGAVFDLRTSNIDVTLTYSRVVTVNIVGEVLKPGSYTIPAINTAFNALMTSGGPTDIGSVRKIEIRRNGKIVKILDVYKFLFNPKEHEDFFLENNDFIYVPVAGKTTTVNGEVKRSHTYELLENEQLFSLLEYAGGLNDGAYKPNIQITRYRDNAKVLTDVNLDSLIQTSTDFELASGDEVMIHKIPEEIINTVELIGAINIPGLYELREGDQISDIILRADGVHIDAYLGTAYVLRLKDDLSRQYFTINLESILKDVNASDNLVLQNFDIVRIFSKASYMNDFNVAIYGEVRQPGEYLYGEGLTLKDLLYISGGLKIESANNRIEIFRVINFDESIATSTPTRVIVKTVSIDRDLAIDVASAEFVLEPFDQIYVRRIPGFEMQQNVTILGEIQYPGIYSLLDNEEKLSELISRSGGLTEWAFPEGATLYRESGIDNFLFMDLSSVLKNNKVKTNYILKEGDKIIIPRINELVTITGMIDYPGSNTISSPYHRSRRAAFYVIKYGAGFTKGSRKGRTYVMSPSGLIVKTNRYVLFNIYPKVSQGSTIFVVGKEEKVKKEKDERKQIDWNNVIEKTTIKLTGVLTLYLLLDRVTNTP